MHVNAMFYICSCSKEGQCYWIESSIYIALHLLIFCNNKNMERSSLLNLMTKLSSNQTTIPKIHLFYGFRNKKD